MRDAFHTQIHKYVGQRRNPLRQRQRSADSRRSRARHRRIRLAQQLPPQELPAKARQSRLRSHHAPGHSAVDAGSGSGGVYFVVAPGDFAVQYDVAAALYRRHQRHRPDHRHHQRLQHQHRSRSINSARSSVCPPIRPRSSSTATIPASTASTIPTAPTATPLKPISTSSGPARSRPTPPSIWSSPPTPRSKAA